MNRAQFIKRCVLGAHVETIYHKFSVKERDEKGKVISYNEKSVPARKIVEVKSTQIGIESFHSVNKRYTSWISFPKASEVVSIDKDTIQINEDDGTPLLTYKFVTP